MSEAARPRRAFRSFGLAAALGAGALALYGIAGLDKVFACASDAGTLANVRAASVGEVAAVMAPDAPRPMPPLAFKDAAGADVGLDRFKGKVVLLNLWATWCAPCRREMPALDALQGERGGADFEVVPVSLDLGSADKPKAFLEQTGVKSLKLYLDPAGRTFQALKAIDRGSGLPTTLILDREGCEIAYLPGPAEWSSPEALKLIDAALGK